MTARLVKAKHTQLFPYQITQICKGRLKGSGIRHSQLFTCIRHSRVKGARSTRIVLEALTIVNCRRKKKGSG